jgi:flavin-dependent dehydrogenase
MREIVVIGGGLAGAAAAAHLARGGHDVLLLERTTGAHDKVCGEFLSYEAQEELEDLGIDLRALGAVPIGSVVVERGRRRAEAALPFEGLSLSRRMLDEALLARAAVSGAKVRRGVRVRSLTRSATGWTVGSDGGTWTARHVILATGKHDLHGWRRPAGPQGDLLGLKTYLRNPMPKPRAGTVELHLFPGGYAGLEPVEGDRANLCLVVRQDGFAAMGRNWDGLLSVLRATCPGLEGRIEPDLLDRTKPLAIAAIPYGLVQSRSDGIWRVGDQAAVIPSFTGEGMSIALHSARLAAAALIAGQGPEAFQARLAADLRAQVRRSTLISRALVAPVTQAVAGRLLCAPLLRWTLGATRISEKARAQMQHWPASPPPYVSPPPGLPGDRVPAASSRAVVSTPRR